MAEHPAFQLHVRSTLHKLHKIHDSAWRFCFQCSAASHIYSIFASRSTMYDGT